MLNSISALSRRQTTNIRNSLDFIVDCWLPPLQTITLAGRKSLVIPSLPRRRNNSSSSSNNQEPPPGRSPNPFYRKTRTEKSKSQKMSDAFRRWESAIRSPPFADTKKAFEFTIMSYNVLAQDLINLHPHLYQDHQQQYLRWPHRFELLLRSFREAKPQILCLQEVQSSHLQLYIKELQTLQLTEHIFKKRTSDCSDGCAIFYDSQLLELLDTERIEYFQPDVQVCINCCALIAHDVTNSRYYSDSESSERCNYCKIPSPCRTLFHFRRSHHSFTVQSTA